MNWNVLAEWLAFASGLFLLVPAFRSNRILRRLQRLTERLKVSRARFDQVIGRLVHADLSDNLGSWSPIDDGCLKFGAVLFTVSGLIKLILN